MHSEKSLTPETILLASFVFAGFSPPLSESPQLGLSKIVAAVRKRDKCLANAKSLDDDIVRNARQKKIAADFRDSAEFRYSVYAGEGEEKFAALYNERVNPRPDPDADVQLISETIQDVPDELRKLFALSDKYKDKRNLKAAKITNYLNSDYTLEKTGFKNAITALHVACWKNDYGLIKLLVERGGDVEAMDFWGKRPLDYTRDRKSLKELGTLQKADDLCKPRGSLKTRVMQKVSFVVEKQRRFDGKVARVKGRGTAYDMFNKTMYVIWDDDIKKREVEVAIHKLVFVKCVDSSPEVKTLFGEIKERVEIVKNGMCVETAKALCAAVVAASTSNAFDFIVDWQEHCYEEIMSDTILEMIGEEANLDIAEAVAVKKRKEEAERKRLMEITRKKEAERIKALNFKKYVHDFTAKKVNKMFSETVPWLGNLMFYFRKFDLDHSGTLSPVEMVAALRSLGITKKIQQENIAIQEMFTGFRKAQHEMSLLAFVRDMPKGVYEAIKKNGDRAKVEMEMKRKMLLGEVEEDGGEKKVKFAKKVETKKIRTRKVVKVKPPTDEEIVGGVVGRLVDSAVKRGREKRVIAGWFEAAGKLDLTGGAAMDRTFIECKVLCCVGDVCIYEFVGEDVLPKPKPNMDDDEAMDR